MSYSIENKRLVKNSLLLYIRTAIILVISLYISRILLSTLGIEDYGIYNVVGGIIVLFTFLSGAMVQACQRFITVEIGKGKHGDISKILGVCITALLYMVIPIVIIAETIGYWFLNTKLNIPFERLEAAEILFHFTIITFICQFLRIPFEALVISNERMRVYAYISIIEIILKLISVLLLKVIPIDNLVAYGASLSIVSFIVLMIYYIYSKCKFSKIGITLVRDIQLLKNLFSFIGWTLLGSGSSVATQQGFIFCLNLGYGVVANAAIGITNQVTAAVSNFIGSFQSAFRPQIIKAYAVSDNSRLFSLINRTSKLSFLLMFFPTLVLIFNLPLILKLWLGNVPQYTVPFCRLILICCIIDATTGPYFTAIMATGKIRAYQICISCSFILDLIISACLIFSNISPTLVLYSRICTRGVLNMLIGLYFLRKRINFPISIYLKRVLFPLIIFIIILIPTPIILCVYFSGWQLLILSTFAILLIGSLIAYRFLLDSSEQEIIRRLLFF